jgi:signal transduction histidine kinase
VLSNLLDNAYRHSPAGSAVVISAAESEPGTVTVCVADHGPGVSPDRRGEIFGFYVRRSGGGTGLGLAIAKTFVDAHHQRIWVESGTDGGARFCFTLPVAIPAPRAA